MLSVIIYIGLAKQIGINSIEMYAMQRALAIKSNPVNELNIVSSEIS